ncbi:MAG: methyltransferase [Candidatus Coatesbacteria bacterium]|nr:methyltransferase [Candidatus Coatesbacteria bacterium]
MDAGIVTEEYALFGGALRLLQPRRGAKTSLDAVLLADFVSAGPGPLAELGLGHGAALLAAVHLGRAERGWGLELRSDLVELARFNAELNGLELEANQGDLRELDELPAGGFRRVIANPPFRAVGDGRRSPDPVRDAARRETTAGLADFLTAAARLLDPGGLLSLVFTVRRLAELIQTLVDHHLEPKRLRPVHPRRGAAARLVLVEARRDGGVGLTVEPPLLTHEGNRYSPELAQILAGRTAAGAS